MNVLNKHSMINLLRRAALIVVPSLFGLSCQAGPQAVPETKAATPPALSMARLVRDTVAKIRALKSYRLKGDFEAKQGSTVLLSKKSEGVAAPSPTSEGTPRTPDFYYEAYEKRLGGGPPGRLFSNGEKNRVFFRQEWLGGPSAGYPEGGMALYNPHYTVGVLERIADSAGGSKEEKIGDAPCLSVTLGPKAVDLKNDLEQTGFQVNAIDWDQARVEAVLSVAVSDGLPRRLVIRARGTGKDQNGNAAPATFDATVTFEGFDEPVKVEIPAPVRKALGWENLKLP